MYKFLAAVAILAGVANAGVPIGLSPIGIATSQVSRVDSGSGIRVSRVGSPLIGQQIVGSPLIGQQVVGSPLLARSQLVGAPLLSQQVIGSPLLARSQLVGSPIGLATSQVSRVDSGSGIRVSRVGSPLIGQQIVGSPLIGQQVVGSPLLARSQLIGSPIGLSTSQVSRIDSGSGIRVASIGSPLIGQQVVGSPLFARSALIGSPLAGHGIIG